MAVFGMHIDLVDRPLSMKIGDTGKLKKKWIRINAKVAGIAAQYFCWCMR